MLTLIMRTMPLFEDRARCRFVVGIAKPWVSQLAPTLQETYIAQRITNPSLFKHSNTVYKRRSSMDIFSSLSNMYPWD